jgi:hypothetical protein
MEDQKTIESRIWKLSQNQNTHHNIYYLALEKCLYALLAVRNFILNKVNQIQNLVLTNVGRKKEGYKKVYNLQVDGCHEYFANNILVHNCVFSLGIAVQMYRRFPETGGNKYVTNSANFTDIENDYEYNSTAFDGY